LFLTGKCSQISGIYLYGSQPEFSLFVYTLPVELRKIEESLQGKDFIRI
jgi:hypothetical protein